MVVNQAERDYFHKKLLKETEAYLNSLNMSPPPNMSSEEGRAVYSALRFIRAKISGSEPSAPVNAKIQELFNRYMKDALQNALAATRGQRQDAFKREKHIYEIHQNTFQEWTGLKWTGETWRGPRSSGDLDLAEGALRRYDEEFPKLEEEIQVIEELHDQLIRSLYRS